MAIDDLRKSDMMAHLLDALDAGQDIGHYGQLTFAMIGRHFLEEDELVSFLTKGDQMSEEDARSLYHQVQGRDYNPPKRDRILQWQQEQEFPICPNADDPDACNVYSELDIPQEVLEDIQEYRAEEQVARDS